DDDAGRARGEVPEDPGGRPRARLPLAGQSDLPGLPDRPAQARLRALGFDHPQPVRLEGPVLPAHGRDLPDVRGAARGNRMGALRARQRRPLRALRDPLRVRAVGRLRGDLQHQGDRKEHGLDADGLAARPATSAGLGAAANASPGVVLSRARITEYGRSLGLRLARFSRARASATWPDDLLLVCATRTEERVARKLGTPALV